MIKNIALSFCLYAACIILIILYSFVVYFSGHIFWQENARGSLIIDKNQQIRGSYLIAQNLDSKSYFTSRTIEKFDTSCDVALYNNKLKTSLLDRYKEANNPYDISSLTPSSRLLDPYIMKRDAIKQAIVIAKERGIDINLLFRLIEDYSLNNQEPFFELEIVNTTILNSILDGY